MDRSIAQKRKTRGSVLSSLDELLRSVRLTREQESLDNAVTDYYTALSDKHVVEQAAWGDFALAEFRAKRVAT